VLIVYCFQAGQETTVLSSTTVETTTTSTTIESTTDATVKMPGNIHKTRDYIFYNNFNNKCPITTIFGTVISKSMRHRKMVTFPTSPI